MYILVRELDDDLRQFVHTGRADTVEFRVFSKEREAMLVSEWVRHGYGVTYGSQKIDYMGKVATITYLKIKDAASGVSISLIPWFMVPGRPFPIFVYLYAIWYYHKMGQKSLKESAAATGKLFKIKGFNKSTVSRSIKAMKSIVDADHIANPLSVEMPEIPSDEDMLSQIPELIDSGLSIETLKEKYGEMLKTLPAPIRQVNTLDGMLSEIPGELFNVIKGKGTDRSKARDIRARPARRRTRALRRVQQQYDFADHHKIEGIRAAFIEICRHLVMDAALKYHCFLV